METRPRRHATTPPTIGSGMYTQRRARGKSGGREYEGSTDVGGSEATSKQKARSGENEDKLKRVCVCVCVKDDMSVGESG